MMWQWVKDRWGTIRWVIGGVAGALVIGFTYIQLARAKTQQQAAQDHKEVAGMLAEGDKEVEEYLGKAKVHRAKAARAMEKGAVIRQKAVRRMEKLEKERGSKTAKQLRDQFNSM